MKNQTHAMKDTPPQDREIRQIIQPFSLVIGSALVIAALAVGPICEFRAKLMALLWALACLAGGLCAGFLFGIPKIQQTDHSKSGNANTTTDSGSGADRQYRALVNTNLVEISDWLTKIIVGLGLINLKALPDLVLRGARVLATSLSKMDPSADYVAFAVAVILGFLAMGFLFGYLLTRLYLAAAFVRADLSVIETTKNTANAATGAVESIQAQVTFLAARLNQFESASSPSMASRSLGKSTAKFMADDDSKLESTSAYQNQLLDLARKYNDFRSENQEERVRTRNDLANQMATIINCRQSSRDWVTETAFKEMNVGLVAGLATAINAEPDTSDVARLLRVARGVPYKHARYIVTTAFGRLFDGRFATRENIQDVLEILNSYYRNDSSDSLRRRVSYTLAQITRATGIGVGISPP
jgi:hypothetical protein